MDINFFRALALVLKSEGGWSDNPADPGGATTKGVTLANFRRYVKADATKADLRKISDDQVAIVDRRSRSGRGLAQTMHRSWSIRPRFRTVEA